MRDQQRPFIRACDQPIPPIGASGFGLIVLGRHYPVTIRWAFLPLSLLVGLALCIGQSTSVSGQGLNTKEIGVRHAIIAAIEADQESPAAKQHVEAGNATVDILVRILDYASDSRFYGVVDGKFSKFDPSKGTEPQKIWADRKCHQNRGFPRIWVLAIDGKYTRGKTVSDVAARPRHVGELLPRDEVVTQRDPKVKLNDPNQTLVTLAKTTESGIRVELILNSTKCLRND